jgi:predicted ATP-dependent serine protease
VGRSPDRFEPPDPLLFGRDPGVRDPRCEGDMNVKRLRDDGVLGVDGGTEVRVDERGGVRGGSIIVVFADNSSPNISFLMRALYILSASSSSRQVSTMYSKKRVAEVVVVLPRWASISLALCFLRGFDGDVL